MLNYESAKIIEISENGFFNSIWVTVLFIILWIALAISISYFIISLNSTDNLKGVIKGLILSFIFATSSLILSVLVKSYADSIAKIEVTGLEVKQEEMLIGNNSERFAKEGNKLYYLAPVNSKMVNSIKELKDRVDDEFQKDLFNGLYKTK